MKSLLVCVAAVACLLASASLANTITFETASSGSGFTGPVTEDGFTYSTLSGGLYVNDFGNPGQDLEGTQFDGGGVVKIVAVGGGDFTFDQLDYAAYDRTGSGSQTLTVNGLFNGSLAFTDTYTQPVRVVRARERGSQRQRIGGKWVVQDQEQNWIWMIF